MLLLFTCVLSVGGCASVEPAPAGASDPAVGQALPGKIIGGWPFDGLPAVGALTYNGSPFCTGTLIDSRTVLTAGHCVEDGSVRLMRFAIGPSAWDPEAEVAVASIETHPDYDPEELLNDLGLVHLKADAPAEPIALLDGLDESWEGVEMLFVGYGFDDPEAEAGLGEKRAVVMPIDDITDVDLVFGGPDANICDGDSGSPVLHQQSDGEVLVAGVVSYGDDWCEEYGGAVRVDPYFDFIFGETQDPCDGETYYGRCQGNTLIWCEDDAVQSTDCSAVGAVCQLWGDDGYFCVEQ